ncbi:MAG: gamma-glutamyltransferase [Rhizobiaceae bacterium]
MRIVQLFTVITVLAVTAFGTMAQQAADTVAPEADTGISVKPPVIAKRQMVVSANPHATRAGLEILRKGGSAADALVAVQTVLGLVEPQSSGIGGGGFLVWFDAKTGEITTIDGRETAPATATNDLFLGPDREPLKFFDAVIGGRSVGTPGIVRLMELIHKRHGKLPWDNLFGFAAKLAEEGFEVSPRLAGLIAYDRERLFSQASTRSYFFDTAGNPLQEGHVLKNIDYGEAMRSLAQSGPDAFYTGAIADSIINTIQLHPGNPGELTVEDLTAYRARERDAVCAPYRDYEVCGMGPPSSGALTVGQILAMIEPFDLAELGPNDPVTWRIIGDATRLAFADRGRYMADSDFVKMPSGLLDKDYLASRSALLIRQDALPQEEVKPGEPPWDKAELRLDGAEFEMPSTTHFVIVDDDGNVASMTSSIENAFGARQMASGFLLNNQLTDFSFVAERDGQAVANRVEPGKRPRSSMSPTIILKDGKPVFALGSPGGSNIIPYVAKTIVALVDWKMNPQEAVSLPHLTNRFGRYDVEEGTVAEALAPDLEAFGFKVAARSLNSGLHVVAFTENGLEGGADPRREGLAAGD